MVIIRSNNKIVLETTLQPKRWTCNCCIYCRDVIVLETVLKHLVRVPGLASPVGMNMEVWPLILILQTLHNYMSATKPVVVGLRVVIELSSKASRKLLFVC